MAQNEAPSQPQQKFQFVDINTGNLTQYGLQILEGLWRQQCAGFVNVPCDCTNVGNVYTLLPILQAEGGASYGDHMSWSFVASATSTGAVTGLVDNSSVNGAPLPTIKFYKNGGLAQAVAGDVVLDTFYVAYYNSTLNAGAGGLVLK